MGRPSKCGFIHRHNAYVPFAVLVYAHRYIFRFTLVRKDFINIKRSLLDFKNKKTKLSLKMKKKFFLDYVVFSADDKK